MTALQALLIFSGFLILGIPVAYVALIAHRHPQPFRCFFAVALIVIAALVLRLNWDDAGTSVSLLHQRLFLLGWTAGTAAFAISFALKPKWHDIGARLVTCNVFLIGLNAGLTIGTRDWAAWSFSQDTMFALMLLVYLALLTTRIHASNPTVARRTKTPRVAEV